MPYEWNVPAAPTWGTLGRRSRAEPAGCAPFSSFQTSLLFRPTIDLTNALGNHEGCHSFPAKKRHCFSPPETHCLPPPEASRELKLTCAICMDTMEQETSTICGHIFCRKCIVEAIRKQKKCPTCRKRLVNSQIHRIYLS
ncbi:hypothetical protein L7F22_004774 [Adiantum nelumboides]|nr:hypothetical protein [Adiantum nelumboides]